MSNLLENFPPKNHNMLSLPLYDDHTQGHGRPTTLQLALFQLWCGALFLFLTRFFSSSKPPKSPTSPAKTDDVKIAVESEASEKEKLVTGGDGGNGNGGQEKKVKLFTAVKPPPTFDEFLRCLVILGVIMFYFYLGDYAKVLPKGERVYARDTFLFLVFLLFLVACAFTISPTADKILNRDQTEEWKGWMQVMFVWYHYFAAKEWYNWIRVYIAAYVWMTGFGNFSFFWVKADFSIWRVMKMLFRLNFLVLVICAVVSNEYMLYYICAMHTHWFLSVYATMAIYPSLNKTKYGMPLKFAIYAAFNFLIFDVGNAALYVFRPLYLILGFNDGKTDVMHEWQFRAGLDHWVAFIGMLCAYFYPNCEAFILKLEKEVGRRQHVPKAIIALILGTVFLLWLYYILPHDKFSYNAIHPYTSFIPIVCFIYFRNMYPVLRTHYIQMFAFLGRITLETYLSQLHIYLQSNAKHLIVYLPEYPLLNFALVTTLYLVISYVLFNLTTDLSAYLLPKDFQLIGKNFLYFFGLMAGSYCLALVLLSVGIV